MEEHGHELEHCPVLANARFKGLPALIRGKAHHHTRAGLGWHGDRKPVADTVVGSLFKDLAPLR